MLKDRLEANNQPRRLNIHTRGTDESIYLRKHKVPQVFPEIFDILKDSNLKSCFSVWKLININNCSFSADVTIVQF